MSSAQRRKLGDISNLQGQAKQMNREETHQRQDMLFSSKEYAEKLQKALPFTLILLQILADCILLIRLLYWFFFLQENVTLMKALAHRKYPSSSLEYVGFWVWWPLFCGSCCFVLWLQQNHRAERCWVSETEDQLTECAGKEFAACTGKQSYVGGVSHLSMVQFLDDCEIIWNSMIKSMASLSSFFSWQELNTNRDRVCFSGT